VTTNRRIKPQFCRQTGTLTAATAATAATNTNINTNTNVIFVQRSASTHTLTDKSAGTVCLKVGKPENVACFRVIVDSVPHGDNILGTKTTNKIYFSPRSQFIMLM
jgi:hypothetical protein